jgi:hypothetical protein
MFNDLTWDREEKSYEEFQGLDEIYGAATEIDGHHYDYEVGLLDGVWYAWWMVDGYQWDCLGQSGDKSTAIAMVDRDVAIRRGEKMPEAGGDVPERDTSETERISQLHRDAGDACAASSAEDKSTSDVVMPVVGINTTPEMR